MWDLKSAAPAEIRGTFEPIATPVPGTQICQHLPRTALLADRYAIVRSMSHNENDHLKAGYWTMTGARLDRPVVQASGMSRNDRPHAGAVISRALGSKNSLPGFVMVPEFISPVGVPRPGQHAGFLGARFDPYLLATDPNSAEYSPGPIGRPAETPLERLRGLHDLSRQLDRALPAQFGQGPAADYAHFQEQAFDLVNSRQAQQAFDLSREPPAMRDRYGRNTFGQSTLVARRLVEAGVRLVQVNFERHDNGKGGQGYDSHGVPPSPPHLPWARDQLLPPTDAAFASLVSDLEERGLLGETLVMMLGEFGRTPRFNTHGGRDHWSHCYSLVLAGGGVKPGLVHGASDKIGAYPVSDPVTPTSLLATVYLLLGIDHHGLMHDLQNRPQWLADEAPVRSLLA
jgi:hypothetical protein